MEINIDKINNKMKILCENIVSPPDLPNTLSFWHGGNLDDYSDIIAQKNGRYEYGAGLYLITLYDIAKKYAKGSRKLYLVTVNLGVDIANAKIDVNAIVEFMNMYVIKNKRKDVWDRLQNYIENGFADADVFNNLILNSKAISGTNTKELRQFLVDNGIDYEMVDSPFGFGERMMVLYNMDKIANIIQVKPTDTIEKYNLLK